MKKKKKKKIIEVTAGKPVYGGKCLAEYEGKKVMLERALPGEKVKAFVKRKKKSYIEASAQEILEPSPYRRESDCRYYPVCGGCKLRDVEYGYQAQIKEMSVKDCIDRIGKVSGYEFLPIVQADCPDNYRNKMEFTFSEDRYYLNSTEPEDKDKFSLGLHAPRFYSKVIDIQSCRLQPDIMNRIYGDLRRILKNSGLKPYNNREHTGFLRHLVMRITTDSKVMINLVTKSKNTEALRKAAEEIRAEYPQVISFINTVNTGLANTAFGEESILISGESEITDTIGELKFSVSSDSFFQINPSQTPKLYDLISEMAEFEGDENVLDLYCGVGTISLYISGRVRSVTGFELVENAVLNAEKNALLNGIKNAKFYSGDLMDLAKEESIFKEEFDTVITDPPRDGMHPKVVKSIIDSGVKKIVYVSCNPSTFARDINLLQIGGYELMKVRPVDMFPQTYHVETVGYLIRK